MKEGPDIARLGALIGDPARANILSALMSGKSLTATELAGEAGVTLQTASSHLRKLEDGNLIVQTRQGRHRYFRLAGDSISSLLETMMGVAVEKGHTRTRTGPSDPALRNARVCYNHLAGKMGVRMLDWLTSNRMILGDGDDLILTDSGNIFFKDFGIDMTGLQAQRRPVCRACLDWSARRHHLAGSLGTAILDRFYELRWAAREEGSRVVTFSGKGIAEFERLFS